MLTANPIACLLVTHVPVKAQIQRCPELRGKPVVITESYGSKTLVLDSSAEARGVATGMSLQEATSRCKDAVLLQADGSYYHKVFNGLVRALESRSPLVEEAGLGCAYIGLHGLETMYGGEARLIATLLQAAPLQFNPRMGVAQGKFPAYIAAVTSNGGRATKAPADVAAFLKGFSIDLLPLSWENKTRLHRFGLHTLGQLAGLSVGSIQAQLKAEGRRAWELANGVDHSPLVACPREEVVDEFLTFPSPTVTLHAVLTAVETLLGRAFSRPEVKGRYVRAASIESQILHHAPWAKRFAFKNAVGSKEKALFILKGRLDALELPGPLEDMRLTLAGFAGEAGIQSRLFSDVRKKEQLREMMRQLEVLLGCRPPIYQMRDVEQWSRIPERRQALVPFDP